MKLFRIPFALTFFSLLGYCLASAQTQGVDSRLRADSLRHILYHANSDSARYQVANLIYELYVESNRDSALHYANLTISIARKNSQLLQEGACQTHKAYQLLHIGHYGEALESLLKAFQILENEASERETFWVHAGQSAHEFRLDNLAQTHIVYALLMDFTENQAEEIQHFKISLRLAKEIKSQHRETIALMNLGWAYNTYRNELDSALYFHREAEKCALESGHISYLALTYVSMGDIYLKKNDRKLAKQHYDLSRSTATKANRPSGLVFAYNGLTKYHLNYNHPDSSLYYAWKTTNLLRSIGGEVDISLNLGTCYESLYRSYQLNQRFDSAFSYLELALVTKDSLYKRRIKHLSEFQTLNFREQIRLRSLEDEMEKEQTRIRTYLLIAGLLVLVLVAILLYRNNQQKQKANLQLQESYSNLRNAQSQLIQSEKMASLGELTAGIAHEIQNPLNFVNNFSEVNSELISELKDAAAKGKLDEVKSIASTLEENERKIVSHGKRADAIVKGMLQHSRKSSGQKEPTDINDLCDEYLRLAYHGLRAKDKSFNAKFETHLDPALPKINVVPQDIGRVVLNLINNAFYAVSEKAKQGTARYEPTVSVRTSLSPGEGRGEARIQITVSDNGPGIPDAFKEKIFQPFFTTKPTGQGTGLGLSLSYDIVKAHGGELRAKSLVDEGTVFTIELPLH
jgi:signal transduction histidine kinase